MKIVWCLGLIGKGSIVFTLKPGFRRKQAWDLAGSPVVRTSHFVCREHGFNPWLETKILQAMQCDHTGMASNQGCFPIECQLARTRDISLFTWMCVCSVTSVMLDSLWPHGLCAARLLCPWGSSGKNTGVGCRPLLQGIFSIQGLNLGFLHCRQILYMSWATRKAKEGGVN